MSRRSLLFRRFVIRRFHDETEGLQFAGGGVHFRPDGDGLFSPFGGVPLEPDPGETGGAIGVRLVDFRAANLAPVGDVFSSQLADRGHDPLDGVRLSELGRTLHGVRPPARVGIEEEPVRRGETAKFPRIEPELPVIAA